jgi:hypothetical protein
VAQGTNTHKARAIAKESANTGDGMTRMEFLRRCALRKSWGAGRLFYVGVLVAFFGTVLRIHHGLVIPTIMDLPAIPFQYSLNGEGEYIVKMRLEPAKASRWSVKPVTATHHRKDRSDA